MEPNYTKQQGTVRVRAMELKCESRTTEPNARRYDELFADSTREPRYFVEGERAQTVSTINS